MFVTFSYLSRELYLQELGLRLERKYVQEVIEYIGEMEAVQEYWPLIKECAIRVQNKQKEPLSDEKRVQLTNAAKAFNAAIEVEIKGAWELEWTHRTIQNCIVAARRKVAIELVMKLANEIGIKELFNHKGVCILRFSLRSMEERFTSVYLPEEIELGRSGYPLPDGKSLIIEDLAYNKPGTSRLIKKLNKHVTFIKIADLPFDE